MEIRFDRDLRHNYMVLCGLQTTEDYRLRMLAENCPEGLLKCSLRNINGTGFLYYEIDSKQPLRNRYTGGSMRAEDLRRLLQAIDRLRETLEDYLLDAEHVLFSADCVYTDMRRGDFYFVYCPFSEGDASPGSAGFSTFAEELLSFLDPGDEEAARIAYELCEMAGGGEMLLSDMIRVVLTETDPKEEEPDPFFHPRAARTEVTEETVSGIAEQAEETPADSAEKRREVWPWVLAVLFVTVFAANLIIRRRFWLNERENLLSLATAILSALMTLVSLVLGIRGESRASKKADADLPASEDGWMRTQWEEAELFGETAPKGGGGTGRTERKKRVPEEAFSADEDEETTVLGEEDCLCTRKLYGRSGRETINISLEHLPLTVGKLSGCADFVIRDPSISRMHTRFLGDPASDSVQMKDLNSTNGTFLNGRRLRPNESVSIRPGDEIGIGRLLFEMR
ncbi:MAG: FHA domain-containing protein [Lachnospiraceae bacterium]|nr:FHA domain-containing protein [Lachnospiraceae bacterium]